jgi:hypothetical protein
VNGLEQVDGYWNVFFGLSMRQGFSLVENNAILRNEGYFIGKMAR